MATFRAGEYDGAGEIMRALGASAGPAKFSLVSGQVRFIRADKLKPAIATEMG
jgi:hypothetical protein